MHKANGGTQENNMKFPAILIILIAAQLSFAQQASITFTTLGPVGRVRALNKSNTIVGYTLGGDTVQGFSLQNGTTASISASTSVPGTVQTLVNGIENNGRIVGAYYEADNKGAHGFLYFHGAFTTLDFPSATFTIAHGINDPGDIVGEFGDGAGYSHGFVYRGSRFTQIDISGAVSTVAEAVNNPGDIVGHFLDKNGHRHGFIYSKKGISQVIDVPFAGVTDTFVNGINSSGVIVGSYVDRAGTHGFVDIVGVFTGFDAPGVPPTIGTFVRGINDNGDFVIFGAVSLLGHLG
jgi:probable HAF family extracellular repeat protein